VIAMNDILLVLSMTIGIGFVMVSLVNTFFASVDEVNYRHTSELCRRMVAGDHKAITTARRRRVARPR
jgi:hypothetical protein